MKSVETALLGCAFISASTVSTDTFKDSSSVVFGASIDGYPEYKSRVTEFLADHQNLSIGEIETDLKEIMEKEMGKENATVFNAKLDANKARLVENLQGLAADRSFLVIHDEAVALVNLLGDKTITLGEFDNKMKSIMGEARLKMLTSKDRVPTMFREVLKEQLLRGIEK